MLIVEAKLVGKQFRTNVEIHDSTWIHMKFQESVSRTKDTNQSMIGNNIPTITKLRQRTNEDVKYTLTKGNSTVWKDNLGSANGKEIKVLVCVSVCRTPSREKFGKQEKLEEFDLQEKHQTGEGRSEEESDVTEKK
eukprot:8671897-Karenia_brevis.AAC.1